jgi:hypothetical protein
MFTIADKGQPIFDPTQSRLLGTKEVGLMSQLRRSVHSVDVERLNIYIGAHHVIVCTKAAVEQLLSSSSFIIST